MRRPSRASRLLAGLAAVSAAAAVGVSLAAAPRAARAHDDVRGLWVLRTTLGSPASIDRMVRDAAASGFNTLLVQVRGRGDAWYSSALEPRAGGLAAAEGDFDPLARTIARAHDAGLRVHAWVNVNLVASASALPAAGDHVARRHPEWLMVPRDLAGAAVTTRPDDPAWTAALARWTRANADQVEGLFLSPMVPAAQEHTLAVLDDLVSRYPLDGLHLDYIRYPTPDFDYNPIAVAEFRAFAAWDLPDGTVARLDADAVRTPTAWPDALPDEWAAFRRARLTDLVARAARNAKAMRPELTISAAVLPRPAEARDRKLQDWADWAAAGYLDAVCPMIYTTGAAEFAAQLDEVVAAADAVPVWAGIGAYRLPVARTAANVRAARRGGAAGVLLFSYDSLVAPSSPSRSYLQTLKPTLLEAHAPDGADR